MKNNPNSLDSILDTIAGLVISCEPGDVMTVSEIITSLEKCIVICRNNETETGICTRLLAMAKKELLDSTKDFTSLFSDGVDLLRDAIGITEKESPWKMKRIQEWLEGIRADRTATTPGVPSVSADAASVPEKEQSKEDPSLIDSDQLKLFISDCEERFSRAQELILILEKETENSEAVKELFRIFHTIKGECGFLKLTTLGLLAHNSEGLLDLLRSEKLKVNERIIDILLKGLDIAQELLTYLKSGSFREYGKVPVTEYIRSLKKVMYAAGPDAETKSVRNQPAELHPAEIAGKNVCPEEMVESDKKVVRKTENADSVIKVKAGKVNYLVDMIGELLISLGQMKEDTEGLSQIRKIARTLQYAGMQLRTESVHVLFGTVRRIIRDTANRLGKQVQAVFSGDELEIDRTLIESLEEPLMHLVRNALDHGIEPEEERIQAGKPPEGTIRVTAERRGNNIVISVADDGKGLDRKKILGKAVRNGLIKETDIPDMTESAVFNLIFTPGFSTKETVDLVSGRGVGMDIVKAAVTKAKGIIRTESIPGRGTTFSLFFPLSTAIIDGMTVRTGKNIFIIPISAIVESLKMRDEQIHKVANGVHVLDLRGEMIPIISLAEVFGIPNAGPGLMATIVENANRERFAIANDEIIAKREVVIKSLGVRFRELKGISSGTVLAGGTIGLVLDIEQFIELSGSYRPTEEAVRA